MTVSDLLYREIQKPDVLKVKNIILTSLIEFGANREGFAAVDPEIDDLFTHYTEIGGNYIISEYDGEIVGGAGIAPLKGSDTIWELQKMYLDKKFRGKGIGKKLMEKCIQLAKSKNITQLYLETLDSMEDANYLYKKFGFKVIDKPLGNTGHFGCDKYYLLNLDE